MIYIKYKVALWLLYRMLSGLFHKKNLMVKTVVLLAVWWSGMAVLYWIYKVAANYILADRAWAFASAIFMLVIGTMALRIIYRELLTFCGLRDKDWNWKNPQLTVFHIPREFLPSRSSSTSGKDDGGLLGALLDGLKPKKDKPYTGDVIHDTYYR